MSRALLGFLLRRHWLTCSLCVLAPLVVGAAGGIVFPMMREDMKALEAMASIIDRFSPLNVKDIATARGFFSIPFNHPLVLTALAVAPALPAIGLLAGERGRGGLDLLLATRLERGGLLLSLAGFMMPVSLLMGAAPLAGVALGTWLSGVTDEVSWGLFCRLSVNAWLLSVHLGGVAVLFSVLAPDRARVTTWFAAFLFVMILTAFIAGLWSGGGNLRYATPFGYLDVPGALKGDRHLLLDGGILLASGLLLWGAAWYLEQRRRRV